MEAVGTTGNKIAIYAKPMPGCLEAVILSQWVHVLPGHTKDAAYIAGLWIAHINKIGSEHVSALVTDGAAVNRAAGKLVTAECFLTYSFLMTMVMSLMCGMAADFTMLTG